MTPEQARLLVRQAFREQDLTLKVVREADPRFVYLLRRIAGQIKGLPDPGDLMRETEWRRLRPGLFRELDAYANQLGAQVLETLKGEIGQMEQFARGYIELGVEKATTAGEVVRQGSAVTVGPNQAKPFTTFVMGKEITVTSGELYFKAISQSGVAGQSFAKVFGTSLDKTGGLLTVGQERTGLSRFFMTSIDRLVTQGVLEGRTTEEISQDLIFESVKGGLNLGKTARQLKANATTVVRTAIADANAKAAEAWWDANDKWEWDDPETGEHHEGKIIGGWIFDAVTDSRACPECAMWDQKYAPNRDDLPAVPVHPRCRCMRRPVTATERLLMKEDAEEQRRWAKAGVDRPKSVGSAVELYTEADLRKSGVLRRGESMKDFLSRQRGRRRAAQQDGRDLPERWYATPVKKDGQTFWRKAVDLPPVGRAGVRRVPEWLETASVTTQVDFFGSKARQQRFQELIASGKSAREAMVQLLSVDKVDGLRYYRFKPMKKR